MQTVVTKEKMLADSKDTMWAVHLEVRKDTAKVEHLVEHLVEQWVEH